MASNDYSTFSRSSLPHSNINRIPNGNPTTTNEIERRDSLDSIQSHSIVPEQSLEATNGNGRAPNAR